MENKMEEVAKLLGVELEEEFRIEGYDGFSKITKLGLERYVRSWFMDSVMLIELIKGTAKIVKIPKPILDEKEKEYLSAVIKPFRNTISSIIKYDNIVYDNCSFILIIIKHSVDGHGIISDEIGLPIFKTGTMYKGMEAGRHYTLDELEL